MHKKAKNTRLWITAGVALLAVIALIAILAGSKPSKGPGSDGGGEQSSEQEKLEEVNEDPQEIIVSERSDASYERWLAASAVLALSIRYGDYDIEAIYLTGDHSIEEKMESDGVYILLQIEGTPQCVHAKPLNAERKEAGTVDLSSADMGFSTFDMIDPSSIDTSLFTEVRMEELGDLISQSVLVSVYEH